MIFRLLVTCVSVIIWAVYISAYNSRIIGLLVTFLLNKFTKGAHFKFGMSVVTLSVMGFW